MAAALVAHVLNAWREAERLAAQARPDSPERQRAENAVAILRDLYAVLTGGEGTFPQQRPEPAPQN